VFTLISVFSAVVIVAIRKLLFRKKIYSFVYYGAIGFILLALGVGAGGVVNDAYKRLEKFQELERNHTLLSAQKNPQAYDGMFQIDLKQFENSQQFGDYISSVYESTLTEMESILLGFLLALILELVFGLTKWFLKRKQIPSHEV